MARLWRTSSDKLLDEQMDIWGQIQRSNLVILIEYSTLTNGPDRNSIRMPNGALDAQYVDIYTQLHRRFALGVLISNQPIADRTHSQLLEFYIVLEDYKSLSQSKDSKFISSSAQSEMFWKRYRRYHKRRRTFHSYPRSPYGIANLYGHSDSL